MTSTQLDRFWEENDVALTDPFSAANPHVPLGMQMGYHSMFAELGLPEDLRRLESDYAYARAAAKAYNDLSERVVGRRLLDETAYDPSKRFPYVKGIGELFECPRVWQSNSWWLLESAHDPAELSGLLDRVERLDLRAAMFPDDWDRACRQIRDRHGLSPHLPMALRGPVTLATSIYGTENLLFLILDEPALAERFRDVLQRVILSYFTICRAINDATAAAGAPPKRGFAFLDDNCALLTPEMYAFFGQPILTAVYDRFAPEPGDLRYQHSDSDMGHLLAELAATGMNAVNFGPNVRFARIREAMPRAVVHGTLAPFTFMRNDREQIVAEVRRDLDEARETRGLVVETAGSVNDGTRLRSLLAVIETIDRCGRS